MNGIDPIWLVVGVLAAQIVTIVALVVLGGIIRTLVRALVADSPQDFAKMERPARPLPRQAAEHETEFGPTRTRPLGL